MIYSFACDACLVVEEVEQVMADDHTPPPCPDCGGPRHRLYEAAIHGDEIKSMSYYHPGKGHEVKGHGVYYDIGLGSWIGSKSERRRVMKAKGLREVCPEDYHRNRDTVYQKYYRRVQQER